MFDGSSVVSEIESPTWDAARGDRRVDWKRVDRELRAIASKRAALDAEEARWLREAERLQIWRPLGMVSALDDMERVLGYTPHTARERLRVAKALAEVPTIAESFAAGELAYSAVRELTRVATSESDAEWRDFALGKTVREIEDVVATHAPGSRPSDPGDPAIRPRVLRLELRPDTYARFRQVRTMLADEKQRHLDDDELIAALCDIALAPTSGADDSHGRAKFQVSMTVCARCKQGWQHGGGALIPVDEVAVERAWCDAQHIGSIDRDAPERAHQDFPPAVRRFIWHRDSGRCQTPGCRSTRGLEIHHLRAIADGGQAVASNGTLRCGSCHHAHHDGRLMIRGTAPDKIETRWLHESRREETSSTREAASPRVDVHEASAKLERATARAEVLSSSSKLDEAIVREETRIALVGMGWKPIIARSAIEAAASHVGRDAPLEAWVRQALRHCPLPRS